MTSLPFISLIIAHTGHNYGFYTLLTMVPTYLYNIQHFDLATVRNFKHNINNKNRKHFIFVSQNGFLSALPYILMWIFSIPMGYISDYLIRTGKASITQIRHVSICFLRIAYRYIHVSFCLCFQATVPVHWTGWSSHRLRISGLCWL